MRFSKTQIQVLVILHLVIGVLFAGIFLLPIAANSPSGTLPTDTPPTASTHDKNRLPRIAFSENLYWETNFGGTKTETVKNAYDINGSTYIIGTTNSTDLDFDQNKDVLAASQSPASTFFIKINENGTLGFTKFYSGDLLFSMLHPSETFVIVQRTNNQTSLHTLNIQGEAGKAVNLDLKENETVLDGILDSSKRLNLIIEVKQDFPALITLKVLTLSSQFDLDGGAVFEHPQDLSYVGALPHSKGIIIAANIKGQNSGGMMLYNYNNGSKLLTEHDCQRSDKIYTALNLVAYKNGYAALIIDAAQNAFILTINPDTLKNSTLILLDAPTVTSGSIHTDNTYYYVFLSLTNGESQLIVFDNYLIELENQEPYRSFQDYTHLDAFTFYTSDSYFGGRHNKTLALSIITKNRTLFETAFASTTEKITHIFPFDNYILAICESTAPSFDVGKNFGETDIWLAKLRF